MHIAERYGSREIVPSGKIHQLEAATPARVRFHLTSGESKIAACRRRLAYRSCAPCVAGRVAYLRHAYFGDIIISRHAPQVPRTRVTAKCRASGTKSSPPNGATLAILAESNRYAADMPLSALLQAKASSSHLLPAPCASLTTTEPCVGLRSRPRCGASCVPAARHFE